MAESKADVARSEWVGKPVQALPSPSFVVSLKQFTANCRKMKEKADSMKLGLRPHVKTHKTIRGAELQTEGIPSRNIVVSTLEEARFFSRHAFQDILYGVPLEPSKVAAAAALHQSVPAFHILIDNEFMVDFLSKRDEGKPWSVFLKVDCGYHRAGVDPEAPSSVELVKGLVSNPKFKFQGLYSHSGHSYNCKSSEPGASMTGVRKAAQSIATSEADVMTKFANKLKSEGIKVPVVSIGSTPSCSTVQSVGACTEIHPGNYCLYDRQQVASGSCSLEDVACRVITRVLSVYPHRKEFLVDAGATALHKDPAGITEWGHILGHPEWRLQRLSQECCVVTCSEVDEAFEALRPGSVLEVVPNHSCMTAAGHAVYYVEENNNVVDVWQPCKFW